VPHEATTLTCDGSDMHSALRGNGDVERRLRDRDGRLGQDKAARLLLQQHYYTNALY
jgi:hypothetical protein